MDSLTMPQIAAFIAVSIALIGVYNTVMTAVKNHRTELEHRSKPVNDITERLDAHDRYFAADKRRFELIESDIEQTKVENRMQMKMMLALVRHAIDGNNIDGLKDMRDEVQEYLIDR